MVLKNGGLSQRILGYMNATEVSGSSGMSNALAPQVDEITNPTFTQGRSLRPILNLDAFTLSDFCITDKWQWNHYAYSYNPSNVILVDEKEKSQIYQKSPLNWHLSGQRGWNDILIYSCFNMFWLYWFNICYDESWRIKLRKQECRQQRRRRQQCNL